MWNTCYEDYRLDGPVNKQELAQSMQGFSGCEMLERYGWGAAQETRYAVDKLSSYRESMERSILARSE